MRLSCFEEYQKTKTRSYIDTQKYSNIPKQIINVIVEDFELIQLLEQVAIELHISFYFDEDVFNIKEGTTIMLPGGKRTLEDLSVKDTLYREIREEISCNLNNLPVCFLDKHFNIKPLDANTDVESIMTCKTRDKILNKVYNDIISVIFIPLTSEQLLAHFIPNYEVSGLIFKHIKLNILDVTGKQFLSEILKTFKNLVNE